MIRDLARANRALAAGIAVILFAGGVHLVSSTIHLIAVRAAAAAVGVGQ